MTRFQWLSRFFRLPEATTRNPAPKREPRDKAKPRTWVINGEVFQAFTKSEARGQYKKKHGLKRLPAGVEAREVKPEKQAA